MQNCVRMWRPERARLMFLVVPTLVLLTSAGMYAGVNEWTARGPDGGYTGRPLIDARNPSILYVSAGVRLFKSTDAATSWSELFNFALAPHGTVPDSILMIDPQDSTTIYGSSTVYPGPETFIFRSTDSGATWVKLAPVPKPGFLRAFAIDPANSSTLFVGGDAGLFKSTDGGAMWSEVGPAIHLPDGRSVSAILDLLINPQKPGTLFVVTQVALTSGGGVFKSADGAATWSEANSGLTGQGGFTLAFDPRNPDTLYATTVSNTSTPPYRLTRLFKSTDAGSSWYLINAGIPIAGLAIDPQASGVLYGFSFDGGFRDRGVLRSTDGGATWSQIFSLPANWVLVAPEEQQNSSGPAPDQTSTSVYAGIGPFGIFKSIDGGTSWAASNSGLKATNIAAVAVSPRDPAVVHAAVYGAGLFNSADGGKTWDWGSFGGNIVSLLPHSSGTLFANANGGAFKTTDEGANWVPLGVPGILAIDPVNPNRIYAQGGFKSTDGGASWVKLAIPQSGYIAALAIDRQAPNRLYAGGTLYVGGSNNDTQQVFKSLDGGESWTATTIATGTFSWNTLAVDPLNPATVYAAFACDEYRYYYGLCKGEPPKYKSTDSGATWSPWNLPQGSSLLTFEPHGSIYGKDQSGLLKSVDRGETWSRVSAPGLTSGISTLAIDPLNPNHLFAGTVSAGVFEITLPAAEQ